MPVLMSGLGVAFLSLLDAAMKEITHSYPLMQAITIRYGMGTFFAGLIYFLFWRKLPSRDAVRRNALRAVFVVGTAVCFFTAINRLPLVEAVALTFLAPLLMAFLGRVILKETVSLNALVATLVGFCGVAVIARGDGMVGGEGTDLIGLMAALGCAFFYALSMVLMRQQSAHDSVFTIVFLANCMAFLIVLPVGLWNWQPVAPSHWMLGLLVGLFGTCGHFCLAWAYARGHAARLGVMEYTAFVWAMILGYYFFAEVPSVWTFSGAALIIAACLFATFGSSSEKSHVKS
jgi:S-adenosylmethionine uptake transporter